MGVGRPNNSWQRAEPRMRAKFARNKFPLGRVAILVLRRRPIPRRLGVLFGKDVDAEGGIEARAAEIADQGIIRIQLQPATDQKKFDPL